MIKTAIQARSSKRVLYMYNYAQSTLRQTDFKNLIAVEQRLVQKTWLSI